MPFTGTSDVPAPGRINPADPDPVAVMAAREAAARAAQVRIEKAKVRKGDSASFCARVGARREGGGSGGGGVRPAAAGRIGASRRIPSLSHTPPLSPTRSQILRERVKTCYKEAGVNHLQV